MFRELYALLCAYFFCLRFPPQHLGHLCLAIMASFLQPAHLSDVSSALTPSSRFKIYANSTLSGDELFKYWYQRLCLILGAASVLLPTLKWIYQGLKYYLRRRRSQSERRPSHNNEALDEIRELPEWVEAGSIAFYLGPDVSTFLAKGYALNIIEPQMLPSHQTLDEKHEGKEMRRTLAYCAPRHTEGFEITKGFHDALIEELHGLKWSH